VYYRCHKRDCPTTGIREEVIEHAVTERLSSLTITQDEKDYLASAIRELKARWIEERELSLKNLEVQRAQLTERLTRLTDAYPDGTIEKELFEERKAAILFDRQAIQDSIKSLETNEASVPDLIERFLERAGSLYSSYQKASTAQKRQIVDVVSSNLALREKSVDFALKIPFREIAEREKDVHGGPSRRIGRTWQPILDRLVEHFAREPVAIN
jgi:site-specific DNA recombinase